jgi:hypothetical protein
LRPAESSSLLGCAEIVGVGLPFCVFKALTGVIALHTAVAAAGYALLALAAVDTVLNLVNLAGLVLVRRRPVGTCLTALAFGRGNDVGIALDVFLSFSLVALVVGAGLLARLPAAALPVWNAAVVLNVLGAGGGRLLEAVRRRSLDP